MNYSDEYYYMAIKAKDHIRIHIMLCDMRNYIMVQLYKQRFLSYIPRR